MEIRINMREVFGLMLAVGALIVVLALRAEGPMTYVDPVWDCLRFTHSGDAFFSGLSLAIAGLVCLMHTDDTTEEED